MYTQNLTNTGTAMTQEIKVLSLASPDNMYVRETEKQHCKTLYVPLR